MAEYQPQEIEHKWQSIWQEKQTYKTTEDASKPKYYVLDMFPYPSGAGLHVGHPLGYIASDIVSRYKRQKGFNVLHPMGFDSFGLPAEQYAIQTGQHPEKTTRVNIARYKEQLTQLGFSYDWGREVQTSSPDYYKWTQWIFGKLFNAWYNKTANKAEPISTLIAHLEAQGTEGLNAHADDDTQPITAAAFKALSAADKEAYIQQYRLAYLSHTMVNWCPGLGTVLANDEVKDGVSERGGYPVERKQMLQWSMRITAYSERLLQGLDKIDWPESIKEVQRNWIGRSQGCSLRFPIEDRAEKIEVFTTRIDTIYGVTFLSLAPEHELVASLITEEQRAEVEAYVEQAKNRSERDRMSDVKTISGAFTGSYAINPFNGERVPIWVADYVLAGYGTGAVMAVPCSDTRDYAFAKHFGLPIIPVQEGAHTDIAQPDFDPKAGTMINSGFLNGLAVPEALKAAVAHVEANGWGKGKINYRQRDAIFSRQRYWGEPIPVYFKDGIPVLMPDAELPLQLPEVDAYLPTETGEPPLRRAKDWYYKTDDQPIEPNTMPGWAGSSWYFLRYMDPENSQRFASEEKVNYWGQVDLYMGGAEHATGHLLYSRFWTMFLFDLGLIPFDEPFIKLVNQGMIQGRSAYIRRYLNNTGVGEKWHFRSYTMTDAEWQARTQELGLGQLQEMRVPVDVTYVDDANGKVDVVGYVNHLPDYQGARFHNATGSWTVGADGTLQATGAEVNTDLIVDFEVEKMSKSKYNVVNPDQIVERYGADTLRMYEMFLGPLEQSKPWSTAGIEGTYKFLRRYWRQFFNDKGEWTLSDEAATAAELKVLHQTIKKVSEEVERLSFNTCVSGFMIALNELTALKCNKRAILEPLTVVLSSFAPHLCEELWQRMGHNTSITEATYPVWEAQYLVESTFTCPVSINGKTRASLTIARDLPAAEVEALVLADEAVQKYLEGKAPKRVIVVPNKIVNLVL